MPRTSEVKNFLSLLRGKQGNKPGPNVIVIGGTSGIGQSIARKFASCYDKPRILIVGRNEEAGKKTLLQMTKFNKFPELSQTHRLEEELPEQSDPNFTFNRVDVGSMAEVRKWAESARREFEKVNYLVMSPGIFTMNGRDETSEGIDKKMAVHYYSRFLIINEILPLLQKAKSDGEEARVLSVFSAGKTDLDIDLDDLDLKKNYTLSRAAGIPITYNDFMVEEYANRNPGISFVHSFPGGVDTGLMRDQPWWLMKIAKLALMLMGMSAETCAEHQIYGLTHEQFKDGSNRMHSDSSPLSKVSRYSTPEKRKIVWDHSRRITGIEK
eukprot:TRINITY_DN5667_c0_g2_i1.p1 TRINITY_DN5667_c0_g2~~TRINITY_DN5667_c0_g2_i1.p1  ORF type:complete len:325 (+),score=96.46 TRINITY_DN5667_c0_g2_i1:151-1125(+)